MTCDSGCVNNLNRTSRILVWIDVIIDIVFIVFFMIFLIILLTKPCTKAVRFSNSLKVISVYMCVMLTALTTDLVADIITLSREKPLVNPVVSPYHLKLMLSSCLIFDSRFYSQ